jgi:multidrug efflux pump subunit AcrB
MNEARFRHFDTVLVWKLETRTLAGRQSGWASRFNNRFNASFNRLLAVYEAVVQPVLRKPGTVLALFFVAFAASLLLYRGLGFSYFPQTDAGQFVITYGDANDRRPSKW